MSRSRNNTGSNMSPSPSPRNKNVNKLFPTTSSLVVFVLYMALFINQGILVTASQDSNKEYKYNTVTAVLLTEFVKLIVSCVMYSRDYQKSHRKRPDLFIHRDSFTAYLDEIRRNWRGFGWYMPTAFLYCLYNNLAYTNLANFDPTTYYLLLQLRVGVTGVLFQIFFKQKLSAHQWFSLILLMLGCMIKELDFSKLTSSSGSMNFELSTGLIFILLQTFSSSSAGVYNEWLLKNKSQIPLLFQNSCLYFDSVLCNFLFLAIDGKISTGLDLDSLQNILFTPSYLFVVLNNAAIGIVTSFFLSQLNSVLKTFASALELLFTAILCYLIFGIPVYIRTFISIFVVSIAVWLYSKHPVDNRRSAAPTISVEDSKDEEDLEKLVSTV